MRFCIFCGVEIPLDAKFCQICGKEQPEADRAEVVSTEEEAVENKSFLGKLFSSRLKVIVIGLVFFLVVIVALTFVTVIFMKK